MEHASGAYVGFVDSDDYTDIEMYQKLYEKAKQENADMLFADIMVYRNKTGSSGIFKKEIYRNLTRACRKILDCCI